MQASAAVKIREVNIFRPSKIEDCTGLSWVRISGQKLPMKETTKNSENGHDSKCLSYFRTKFSSD